MWWMPQHIFAQKESQRTWQEIKISCDVCPNTFGHRKNIKAPQKLKIIISCDDCHSTFSHRKSDKEHDKN